MSAAIAFAFGAGVLATVNPCGFAMLPAFLGYYLGHDTDKAASGLTGDRRLVARIGQGFGVGAAVSAGFAAVFTGAGVLLAVGLRQLTQAVPWAAVAIGGLLVMAGVALTAGRDIVPRLGGGFGTGGGRGWRHMAGFGAAYAVASLSCTLGVLLAVVGQAIAAASLAQLLLVFGAYTVGAATVLVGLAVGAALASAALARVMGRLVPVATRLGGVLLIGSGGYLIAYWLPALAGGVGPAPGVGALAEAPSARLTGFLEMHLGLVAVATVVLLVAGAATVGLRRRHRRPHDCSHRGSPRTRAASWRLSNIQR
jgi:cytochrome c-type biogenesis protein